MQIFEYSYVVIALFVVGFALFFGIGVYFAAKAVKALNGVYEKDFVNIGKIESAFVKSGRRREIRCIFHIGIDSDDFRNVNTSANEQNVLCELKRVLPEFFCDGEKGAIAALSDKNYVAYSVCNKEQARERAEECFSVLINCLQKFGAVNLVDIRIGSYFAVGSLVSFDGAVDRARMACQIAINEDVQYAEWDVSKGKALERKLEIQKKISSEIDNDNFFLEYQPVLDASTKKIVGAEVLARLNSESDGILSPGHFLHAVDSMGVNNKFDYYIFEKNCKWISNDKEKRAGYRYTINFSRTTLCQLDFSERIIEIVEKYGLPFTCLAIEILEDKNIVGEAREFLMENLSKLKSLGVSIFLDDFGSGYTTFGDLQNFDISVVKIDRTITQNAVTETGFIILKNLIDTASGIGLKTICEGVETYEQEKAVIQAGCDMLQGFYYHKPMSVTALERLFDKEFGGI